MSLRSHAERWLLPALVCSVCSVAHAHDVSLQRPLPRLSEYLTLGLQHILAGFDHLAFLLGLVLITRRLRPLLLAVTAFTVGHSLSLSASTLGLIQLPTRWVETAIALSIAYVATLNLRERRSDARCWLSGAFGFIHGFGFAGALLEIGLPADRMAPALLMFNLGVELGQLAVLCLVLPALVALRGSPRIWARAALSINVVLLGLGIGWAAERAVLPPLTAPVATSTPAASSFADADQPSAPRPPSPVQLSAATRVCDLFVRLPQLSHAECTGESARLTLEQPCRRVLASAFARDALELVSESLADCETELSAAYAQCDFEAADHTLRMPTCRNSLQARLKTGDPCASALECGTGLLCLGVSPLRLGTCGLSRPESQPNTAFLDPLASYLPHTRLQQRASEVAGSALLTR